MNNEMEIRLPAENKTEAKEVLDIVNRMESSSQRELLTFMKGVAFGRGLDSGDDGKAV